MPTVGDWISLVLIGALVYAIYKGVQQKDEAKKNLSERMRRLEVRRLDSPQDRGVKISSEGISIRSTHAAMDREAYLVRIQRLCRTPPKTLSRPRAPKLCNISSMAQPRAVMQQLMLLSL